MNKQSFLNREYLKCIFTINTETNYFIRDTAVCLLVFPLLHEKFDQILRLDGLTDASKLDLRYHLAETASNSTNQITTLSKLYFLKVFEIHFPS
jgi:hypothetical protein